MYYLLGKKLVRKYNTDIGLYQMEPDPKMFNARIGNGY
jgi:hypothetical protein